MTTTSNSKVKDFLNSYFQIPQKGSTISTEIIAGLTTFLAMVYSIIAVPGMLSDAGFSSESTFIATCLLASVGSIIMGVWTKLPYAIGGDIVLCAFIAYVIVLGQGVSIPVALGAIFLMGILFMVISVTGIRNWILRNLPSSIAHGAGIGIGLFLILISCSNVGIIVSAGEGASIPVKLGDFSSIPVLLGLFGLFAVIALETLHIKGGILFVIIAITCIGVFVDPNVHLNGFVKAPSFGEQSLFFAFDLKGVFEPQILGIVFAFVITTVFDATGTIRAVAGQARLLDEKGQIINGDRALATDSFSSIFAGAVGTCPAAVYIESAAGIAAGAKTGLTALVVGVLFLCMIFFQPLAAIVPMYATAPALMYVGLLMLSNVRELDFKDNVGALSGLITAVFICLSANILTGLMIGYVAYTVGRLITRDFARLNISTVAIAVALFAFYYSGIAL